MRRVMAVVILLAGLTSPAQAQIPVTDVANLVQTILVSIRTNAHYQALLSQYQTILKMADGLGSMEGYRIPTVASSHHEPGRWEFGRPWLEGLNAGDPSGNAYRRTVRRLERPDALLNALPEESRKAIEQAYATIEIADSVNLMAGHQVGALRGYGARLQRSVDGLQDDVLSGLERYHELTAVLDKVAAGELVGRRQDMATNQLLSHLLESFLVRGKRARDADVANMNMRLGELQSGRAASAALFSGSGEDLRTWRQP
jgi:hypothetical protein